MNSRSPICVILAGPNGAGKSTAAKRLLLDNVRRGKVRLLSGMEYPSGNWIAPAGSNLESHGGNEVA
jgi:ABC-type Mn2+/Zn2+ transport system ATPase subunit